LQSNTLYIIILSRPIQFNDTSKPPLKIIDRLTDWILTKFDTFEYKIVNKNKLLAVLLLDWLLRLFPRPSRSFIDEENYNPEKILLVRVAYIGDVILSIPAIKALRERFPTSRLVLLTNKPSAELLSEDKNTDEMMALTPFWFYKGRLINKIIEYFKLLKSLRKENFDLAIDLRGDIRNIFFILFLSGAKFRIGYGIGGGSVMLTDVVPYSGLKHKVEFHLDIARYLSCRSNPSLDLILKESDRDLARRKIAKSDKIVVLGIHPGARIPLKCYPADKFAEALNLILKENRIKLYIFCGESDLEITETIQKRLVINEFEIIKDLSISELAACISELDMFICNDSAPLHIASAFDVPTIAVFGPSDSRETGPIGRLSRVVEKPVDCRENCDENVCKNESYHACMTMINPEEIADAFFSLKEMLKN